MSNARDEAMDLVDQGLVSAEDMMCMALRYLSAHDVADMLDANELSKRFIEEDEDEDEDVK